MGTRGLSNRSLVVKTTAIIACPLGCGSQVHRRGLSGHIQRAHPDVTSEARKDILQKALISSEASAKDGAGAPGSSQSPGEATTPKAPQRLLGSVEDAAILGFTPRRFEVNSTLLWQAKYVCEHEWGWPEMDMGDWLDTFMFYAFKRFGVVLMGYVVENPKAMQSMKMATFAQANGHSRNQVETVEEGG